MLDLVCSGIIDKLLNSILDPVPLVFVQTKIGQVKVKAHRDLLMGRLIGNILNHLGRDRVVDNAEVCIRTLATSSLHQREEQGAGESPTCPNVICSLIIEEHVKE